MPGKKAKIAVNIMIIAALTVILLIDYIRRSDDENNNLSEIPAPVMLNSTEVIATDRSEWTPFNIWEKNFVPDNGGERTFLLSLNNAGKLKLTITETGEFCIMYERWEPFRDPPKIDMSTYDLSGDGENEEEKW